MQILTSKKGGLFSLKRAGAAVISAAIAVMLCISTCMLYAPSKAFAIGEFPSDGIKIESLSAQATMQTDGTLRVVEQRIFDFENPKENIVWEFGELEELSSIKINSVRVAPVDSDGVAIKDWESLTSTNFRSDWREEATLEKAIEVPVRPTYALDQIQEALYIFLEPTEGMYAIECDFAIVNAIRAYDDVAELFWDFVPIMDYDVSSVEVAIQLPVPNGVDVVQGDNVMAWGHGPEGEVDIATNGVISYFTNFVKPDQSVQAHIVFPVEWLGNMDTELASAFSGVRFDNAVSDEEWWSDVDSSSSINNLTLRLIVLVICFLLMAASMALYFIYGRELKPDLHCPDNYGDVDHLDGSGHSDNADLSGGFDLLDGTDLSSGSNPSDCSYCLGNSGRSAQCGVMDYTPYVIGRLLRKNYPSTDDFVASLLSLIDRGAIAVDQSQESLRFKIKANAKQANCTKADYKVLEFLFDKCGSGYQSTTLDDIECFIKKNPQEFLEAMRAFNKEVDNEVADIGLFDGRSKKLRKWMYIVAGVALFASFGALSVGNYFSMTVLLVTAVTVGLLAYHMFRRTRLGSSLEAQAMQLKKYVMDEKSITSSDLDNLSAYLFVLGIAEDAYSLCNHPSDYAYTWFSKTWFSKYSSVLSKNSLKIDSSGKCLAKYVAGLLQNSILRAEGWNLKA